MIMTPSKQSIIFVSKIAIKTIAIAIVIATVIATNKIETEKSINIRSR